jgi:uridylate kinase
MEYHGEPPTLVMLLDMSHVYKDAIGLHVVNLNAPYAQARLRQVDNEVRVTINDGAPQHFIIEVNKHLDKLKTILILGG